MGPLTCYALLKANRPRDDVPIKINLHQSMKSRARLRKFLDTELKVCYLGLPLYTRHLPSLSLSFFIWKTEMMKLTHRLLMWALSSVTQVEKHILKGNNICFFSRFCDIFVTKSLSETQDHWKPTKETFKMDFKALATVIAVFVF